MFAFLPLTIKAVLKETKVLWKGCVVWYFLLSSGNFRKKRKTSGRNAKCLSIGLILYQKKIEKYFLEKVLWKFFKVCTNVLTNDSLVFFKRWKGMCLHGRGKDVSLVKARTFYGISSVREKRQFRFLFENKIKTSFIYIKDVKSIKNRNFKLKFRYYSRS